MERTQLLSGSFHKGKGLQAQVLKPTEAEPEKLGLLAGGPGFSLELCCPRLLVWLLLWAF